MAEHGTAAVLRRKAGSGQDRAREAGLLPAAEPTPALALAGAFRRAAEEEAGLALSATAGERRASLAELLDALPEPAFLGLLIGPEDGAGLLCLDGGALAAVIEMRVAGRVSPRPPPPRRPTRTDAAMVADLIDRVLAEFEAPLLDDEAARWASGWRYQMFVADARTLALVLEDGVHRLIEAEAVFQGVAGGAVRTGRVLLALPANGRAQPRAPESPAPASAEGARLAAWRRTLGEAVEGAEAALDAVLGRLRLPLADLAALQPGDRIALPLAALGAVRLVAPGGVAVAEGRLGQSGGARALRLGAGAAPPVLAPAMLGPQAEGTVIRAPGDPARPPAPRRQGAEGDAATVPLPAGVAGLAEGVEDLPAPPDGG